MRLLLLAVVAMTAAGADPIDEAGRLLNRGLWQEAEAAARDAAAKARQSGDIRQEARAWNLAGGARLFAADYEAAEGNYRKALDLFRAMGETQFEIDVLNNLGSVDFFRGRYLAAWDAYAEARRAAAAHAQAPWALSALQVTEVNQAALLQKLGRHHDALRLYREVRRRTGGLSPAERARMLGNYGALLRRLGDPVRAVELYREALQLQPDHDTELGVRKNLGIALALDLGEQSAALAQLTLVARQAEAAGDARESLQARLYAAEVQRRQGRNPDTEALVLEARKRSLPDELWKALLIEARIGKSPALYERAVEVIETMRPARRGSAPRQAFLQDRAEPYDERIALLRGERSEASEVLYWQERLRARVLLEDAGGVAPSRSLAGQIQSKLAPDEALWSLRVSRDAVSSVWLTTGRAQVLWPAPPAAGAIRGCWAQLSQPGPQAPDCLGVRELIPSPEGARRVYVVADGPLALLPVEIFWGMKVEVVHLPSARSLLRPASPAGPAWPWKRNAAAFAPSLPSSLYPGDERWRPLPFAVLEATDMAGRIGGTNLLLEGRSATRLALLQAIPQSTVVHVAAHAATDAEDPARARILLADGYLVPADLKPGLAEGLRLITLAACDSAFGAYADGEGLQSWLREFLAAGARAAVGAVWKVDDEASYLLMQRFYRGIGEGLPAARALLEAKRELGASRRWSHPAHWAGFVLMGDPGPVFSPVPWASILLAAGVFAGGVTLWLFRSGR